MSKAIKKLKNNSPFKQVSDETNFLLSTQANVARLAESIKQDKLGKVIIKLKRFFQARR